MADQLQHQHQQQQQQQQPASLDPYFLQLVCYAKFVLDQRPNEVVTLKNLSAPWRKEHWERVIADGRARHITRLPNPSSIDSWFDLFRAYKRDLGVRNVPNKSYPVAPVRGRALSDDPHFDQLLRQRLRSTPHQNSFDDKTPVTISDSDSAPSDRESDLESHDDSPSGPVTRSRSKQTVVASKYHHSIAPSAETGRITPPEMESISSRVDSIMRPPAIPKPHQPLAHPARININLGGSAPLPTSHGNQYFTEQQRLAPQNLQQQNLQQQQHQFYGAQQQAGGTYAQRDATAPMIAPVGAVEFVNLLASGGQGSVFLARLVLDRNSLFIVKVFYKEPSQHEVSAMRAMSLTNYSIRLIGETRVTESQLRRYEQKLQQDGIDFSSFQFDRSGCLTGWCFERLHSDLERALLERKGPGHIGNAMKQLIGLQIAYFLRGIHRSNYIFRDLKPSNVLLCFPPHNVTGEQVIRFFLEHQPVIKVADYGLVTSERSSKKTRNAGTMGYMPNAQMASENYDKSVDVTAYCVTLTELLTDDLLYDTNDPDSEIEEDFRTFNVADKVRQRFRAHRTYIPSALTDLILKTLRNENRDIEPFIAFFESSLKSLAFSLDVPRKDMTLLHPEATATPARTAPVPRSW